MIFGSLILIVGIITGYLLAMKAIKFGIATSNEAHKGQLTYKPELDNSDAEFEMLEEMEKQDEDETD